MARSFRFKRKRVGPFGRHPRARRPRGVKRRRSTRARVKRRRPAKRANLEVKTQTHDIRSDTVAFSGGSSAHGPANSLLLLGGLFGGRDIHDTASTTTGITPGTGCHGLIGCYITPAYPSSMKLDINWKTLQLVAGKPFPNPNLRIIHGFYKNTGDKMDASLVDNFSWIDAIRSHLLKELFDSNYDADYLEYTQKSRNIKILSDRYIRPKRATAVQVPDNTTVPTSIIAPNQELSYKWPHKKMKTRLMPSVFLTHDTPPVPGTQEVMMPHNLWVPFLLCLAPGLTETGFGAVTVRSVTKAYFHDA